MISLIVQRLVTEAQALTNTLIHNANDFDGRENIYLKVNNSYIYPSIAGDVNKGYINISAMMRIKLDVSLNNPTYVLEYKPNKNILIETTIKIKTYRKNDFIISFHEDEIKEKIKKNFCSYYFVEKQFMLININDTDFILECDTPVHGWLNNETNIIISSDDVSLNLIGSKLLKRDLFRDDYNFEDIGIGGLDTELISIFRRALSTRAFKPIIAEKLGIKHIKGILLYGPPGTGKTLIARKIGSMITNKEPKIVNGPEIINKYVGQSEENVRALFNDAKNDYNINKENADLHVIIFDEIDAICKKRGGGSLSAVNDTVVNQLLSMIDGVNQLNNIFIIGMTNRKELLDEALLRAGRIEVHIEVGLPNLNGRKQIFRIHTNKMNTNNMMGKDVCIDTLAKLTENYSGAEIESVVKNAGAQALHEQLLSNKKDINESDIIINMKHLMGSIEEILPSFGNINKTIKKLLPEKYVELSDIHKLCYDQTREFISKSRRLKLVLIGGKSGTGKTALAAKIANDSKIKHIKIIRSIDMISFDDSTKSTHISDIVTSSYISEESLIVLEDIEIAINYVKMGNVITFSNKIYQTLMTLLKTEPHNKSHKLTLLVTCGNENLYEVLLHYFDLIFNIGMIESKNILNIVTKLGYDTKNIPIEDVTIKELLNYV